MPLSKLKTLHSYVNQELNKEKWNGKRNRWNYSKIAIDLFNSSRKYKVVPDEYIALDFYELDSKRRKKIITRRERDQFVQTFNDKIESIKVENKKNFLRNFKQYLNRDYLILEEATFEEFDTFYKKYGGYVAKISDSGQGKGVRVVTNVEDTNQAYQDLIANNYDVIEEMATAHPELKKMNPVGLPSLRLITFVDKDGKPHILSSALNLSFDDPVVNTYRGGIKALLNPENGKVVTNAIGKSGKEYKKHPVSQVLIKGFKVPEWNKLTEMLLQAAKEFPTVRYVGWDCSVSDKGPLIIEANAKRPDINGVQIYGYNKADEAYSKFDLVRSEHNDIKNSQ